MNKLKEEYNKKLRENIKKELNLSNIYSVPTLSKIIVNSGVSSAISNPDSLNETREILKAITGQLPLTTKAKYSISNFHLRKGMNIGLKVTMRNERMWDFYEKLNEIVFPRFRDFRGLPKSSFDKKGNYTIGISEHTVFSEVAQMYIDRVKSLQITIVTTANDDRSAEVLLRTLGLPLEK